MTTIETAQLFNYSLTVTACPHLSSCILL